MSKSQGANGQCEVSSTYKEYIARYLDSLREKCSNLTDCLDKLLTEESSISILKGENISLNKTCGLIYKPEGGNYTTLKGKCRIEEREEINKDIEDHVAEQISTNREWNNVKKCLDNRYGDGEGPRVEQICKLAHKNKQICNGTSARAHKRVEDFFNAQIKIMRCSCKSLDVKTDAGDNEISPGVWIGSGVGILIFVIIVFSLLFFCYRRKHQKSLKKRGPNVIYMPAPNSDNPVYQEVFDVRDYCPTPGSNPPSLPIRYITSPNSRQQDDPTYLEPVTAGMKYRPKPPLPGQAASNPGYGSPPRYSECERDSATAEDIENGYFNPLPSPNKDAGDSLAMTKADNNGYETIEASRLSIPMEDAPKPEDIPLGPVPARRTKKEDRQVESNYFVLEKDGVSNEGRNTA